MSIVRIVDDRLDIFAIAERYGYGWGGSIGRPQQVHCPLHNDSTPSARVYPDSNSGYCWTCQESFGPTRLAAEAEGIHIYAAARLLAQVYSIDLTPDADLSEFRALAARWEQGPDADTPEARRAAGLAVRAVSLSWEDTQRLLPLWDALDAGAIKPTDWLEIVRSTLPLAQAET